MISSLIDTTAARWQLLSLCLGHGTTLAARANLSNFEVARPRSNDGGVEEIDGVFLTMTIYSAASPLFTILTYSSAAMMLLSTHAVAGQSVRDRITALVEKRAVAAQLRVQPGCGPNQRVDGVSEKIDELSLRWDARQKAMLADMDELNQELEDRTRALRWRTALAILKSKQHRMAMRRILQLQGNLALLSKQPAVNAAAAPQTQPAQPQVSAGQPNPLAPKQADENPPQIAGSPAQTAAIPGVPPKVKKQKARPKKTNESFFDYGPYYSP